MIHDSRIKVLNDSPARAGGKYVLYWMQQSQRAGCNHALEYAVRRADELGLPVVVCFGLMDGYPEANERHYLFMLQGLRDVERDLKRRNIAFACRHANPHEAAIHYAKEAALLVADRGYLRHQKAWRKAAAEGAGCRVVQVETEVVVPVDAASDKREYAARTLRPKVKKLRAEYLVPLEERTPKHSSLALKVSGDIDVADPEAAAGKLKIDRSIKASTAFTGGSAAAGGWLDRFADTIVDGYDDRRNEPTSDRHSYLSAYLHFGQISPLEISLRVRDAQQGSAEDRAAYLEELLVRRELSMNFVEFAVDYDKYSVLPDWARKTLAEHRDDPRPAVYTRRQLEDAQTADPYWNAAMREMKLTGFMQNYLRMYWGKKVLEWTNTPEYGFDTLMYLNNKYFLCGRDANSYANVAWVFGLHDRPWGERPVFGKIRYMNAKGLDRKFDMAAYVARVDALEQSGGAADVMP